jgi:hypothetical protein
MHSGVVNFVLSLVLLDLSPLNIYMRGKVVKRLRKQVYDAMQYTEAPDINKVRKTKKFKEIFRRRKKNYVAGVAR